MVFSTNLQSHYHHPAGFLVGTNTSVWEWSQGIYMAHKIPRSYEYDKVKNTAIL